MAALIAYIRASTEIDAPLTPPGWDVVPEVDGWSTVYPLGREEDVDVFFHARLVARHPSMPGRAIFVCTGPRAVLDRLAGRIAADALPWTRTWLTLAALRADGSGVAAQIRALWPDERPLDEQGQPIGTVVGHFRRMAGAVGESAEE